MELGDLVSWRGRVHRLRGFDPMSVDDRCVYLEDVETGEVVRVLADEVEPAAPPPPPPG